MTSYYAERLSAERLARCYELASPRMQRYLALEIEHLIGRVRPGQAVLELGCGYGRVALPLARAGAEVLGIDVAEDSLVMARRLAAEAGLGGRCSFLCMDALALDLPERSFDVVACVQNGIGAFRVDAQALLREAWRVLRPGGRLLLSTYAAAIWPERLDWFETQAAQGLVGPIDRAASRDGVIVCSDGFRSASVSTADFAAWARVLGVEAVVEEVDGSSLWCELRKPLARHSSTGAASSHRSLGDIRP